MRVTVMSVVVMALCACDGTRCEPFAARQPTDVHCDSLRFDAEGLRVISGSIAYERGGSALCSSSLTARSISMSLSGEECFGPADAGINMVVSADCELPPLAEGTYTLPSGATLVIPADGGLGECTSP